MPKLPATQRRPAEAPAPRPRATEGRGPRKFAKFHAARAASTNDRPKIFAALPFLSCSSVSPVSRCQALPNSTGEYHRPPSRKQATAATSTASQLTSGIALSLFLARPARRCYPRILRAGRASVLEKTEARVIGAWARPVRLRR